MPIDPDEAHAAASRLGRLITGADVAGFCKVTVFVVLPFVVVVLAIAAVTYGVF